MGYAEYDIKVKISQDDQDLKPLVAKVARVHQFEYRIIRKSLDARKKDSILWQYRVGVTSPEIKGGQSPASPKLDIPKSGKGRIIAIIGCGPAGIFAADYLIRAGFAVHIFERGSPVEDRRLAIQAFEQGGPFSASNNYSFGEGGAGTFSDGKLSSRTKSISLERDWIFARFVELGAPAEIQWLTHPHVGSDRLFEITQKFRKDLQGRGVQFHFNSLVDDLIIADGLVQGIRGPWGSFSAEAVLFATGHSAFETFEFLIRNGVPFVPKNFAIGFRAEHEQGIINHAQWGCTQLPGVKAAEYRLTSQADSKHGVYSFCMCPGGTIVPAASYAQTNIVNGMSNYQRNGRFANAAVVASVQPQAFLGEKVGALEVLHWLGSLEESWFVQSQGFRAPAIKIIDYLSDSPGKTALTESSYPLGLLSADLASLLPKPLSSAIRSGLADFCRTLKGYDQGQLIGLESKTSAPIQALRHSQNFTAGFDNLYIAGEGSGWSGGIVSSAADGLCVAIALSRR